MKHNRSTFPSFQGSPLSEELFAKAWKQVRLYETRPVSYARTKFELGEHIPPVKGRSNKFHPYNIEKFIRENPGCTADDIAKVFDASVSRMRGNLFQMLKEESIYRYRQTNNEPFRYKVVND